MTIMSERLQHLRLTHGYAQTELAGHGCDPPGGLHGSTINAEIPHLIACPIHQVSTDYLVGLLAE